MTVNLDQYIGQAIEVEDPSNLDQCFDWALFVCDLLGIPRAAIRTLRAKDIWNTYDHAYFSAVTGAPQYLDFAIWGSQVGVNGHVAVVKNPTGTGFVSYDQNWNNILRVQTVNHTSYGVIGFLRPKINQGDIMDEEAAKDLYRLGLHREPENDQVWRSYVGMKPEDGMNAIRGSQEWLTQNHILIRAYPAAQDRIAELEKQLADKATTLKPGSYIVE